MISITATGHMTFIKKIARLPVDESIYTGISEKGRCRWSCCRRDKLTDGRCPSGQLDGAACCPTAEQTTRTIVCYAFYTGAT